MAEMKQEIKVFTVGYLCDECGKGFMEPTGSVYLSNPAQYPHKCSYWKCGDEKTFSRSYPYNEQEVIP